MSEEEAQKGLENIQWGSGMPQLPVGRRCLSLSVCLSLSLSLSPTVPTIGGRIKSKVKLMGKKMKGWEKRGKGAMKRDEDEKK